MHSAKLEYLGLDAAVASFCKELSDNKRIEIDFVCDGIRTTLPEEISVSLYRVLQEALQNAASHSGSKCIQVMLAYGASEVELAVRDSGIGFDVQQALKEGGFGLRIMRERLKLVDGELSIESQPGRGTAVHARVAFHVAKSVAAGGELMV